MSLKRTKLNFSSFYFMTSFWILFDGETGVSSSDWSASANDSIGISSASFQRLRFLRCSFLSDQGFSSCLSFFVIYLLTSQSGDGLEAKIAVDEKRDSFLYLPTIALTELSTFPPLPFLRFGWIEIIASWPEFKKCKDVQPIEQKCQLFVEQFRLNPKILDGSMVTFHCDVNSNNSSHFHDYSELLGYLRNQLLPIFDKPRGLMFEISFNSDSDRTVRTEGKSIISSLLQMPQIERVLSVGIVFYDDEQTDLPIDEISNWLHRNHGDQRERSLFISSNPRDAGTNEMLLNHLKEVHSAYFYYILCLFFANKLKY